MKACEQCGEDATLRYLAQDWCDECAPSEDYRFTECSLCYRPMDCAESPLPLCPRCKATCEAHGFYDNEALRQQREERETGKRID